MTIALPSRYQNATLRLADMTQDMADMANVVTQINLGLSPPSLAYLDAYDAVASVAIPTTPTVFTVPTIAASSNMTIDTVTGIITLTKTGTYQTVFLLNCFNTLVTTVFFASESDTGSGFVTLPVSGRQVNVNANINGQVIFVAHNFFTAGTRVRVYIWCSSVSAVFQTAALTTLPGGIPSVVAKRIQVTGVINP